MAGRPKKTILLVEDEESIQHFMIVELQMERYEVLAAASGLQALEVLLQRRCDLIILDLRLPDISGWEVLHRVKADPELWHIPVLILTASATADESLKATQMGAVNYLVKPVSAEDLADSVASILTAV